MHKVVLDTNSLISNGIPHKLLKQVVLENKVLMCISPIVYDEYLTVIARPKFKRYHPQFLEDAVALFLFMSKKGAMFHPSHPLNLAADLDNNRFLELAETTSADFLITGNAKHFPFPKYKNTTIISPSDYWEKHWQNPQA